MKHLVWIALLSLMVLNVSCVTQKRCDRKFPPQVREIVKDSIIEKEKIVYKPVIVEKYLPGDTIHDTTIVTRNGLTGLINSKPLYAETSMAKAKAQVVNSKLYLDLMQKDSTIKFKLDSIIKETTYWREKYSTLDKEKVREVKYVPVYFQIMNWIAVIYLAFTLFYILSNFKKIL